MAPRASSELYDVPPEQHSVPKPVAKPRALYDAPPGDTAADEKREKLIEVIIFYLYLETYPEI